MAAIATNNGVALENLWGEVVAYFHAWKIRRETRGALSELSERQLEDIGMCRADIDTIVGAL